MKIWNGKFKYIKRSVIISILYSFIYWIFCLPSSYFVLPTSTVIESSDGQLLSATIAKDGQWRFPLMDSVPVKFKHCIIQFEDRTFESHIGISARAIGRAIKQNIQHKRIVSGGSTITMQTVRLMRKNPSRTFYEKLREVFWATRLESKLDKDLILRYYSTYAPFGGNVVGLNTASWRYYKKPAHRLTWSQTATLAVLPNAPSLIFPGKNSKLLLAKRNRLLNRLNDINVISNEELKLALLEPLPGKPHALPQNATHLLNFVSKKGNKGKRKQTSINYNIQEQVNKIVKRNSSRFRRNNINNAAVIIIDVKTNKVISYAGNVTGLGFKHNESVDLIQAERSSGSILKPFLYAQAFDEGVIAPQSLLPDVPTHYKGYSPQNYMQTFDGAVPANLCLAKSLNVPAVRLLEKVGLNNFYHKLEDLEINSLHQHAKHYGLSLVLGGAETKLWDLTNAYSKMANVLNHYPKHETDSVPQFGIYNNKKMQKLELPFSPASIHHTFESMLEVVRPGAEMNWKVFSSSRKVAWKTGTSFGFRDAWAVGVTPEYIVGVWVGNASGEGQPGIIGVKAAAPILFDVFNILPETSWFKDPILNKENIKICRESGYKANQNCMNTSNIKLSKSLQNLSSCAYHHSIHLNQQNTHQVSSECYNVYQFNKTKWFTLPPLMEYYYKLHHPEYKTLPPIHPDCEQGEQKKAIALIYPKKPSKIHVPVEIDGEKGNTIFEATHVKKDAVLFWHIDNQYIGQTQTIHQLKVAPNPGKHILKIVDELGNNISQSFLIY